MKHLSLSDHNSRHAHRGGIACVGSLLYLFLTVGNCLHTGGDFPPITLVHVVVVIAYIHLERHYRP